MKERLRRGTETRVDKAICDSRFFLRLYKKTSG